MTGGSAAPGFMEIVPGPVANAAAQATAVIAALVGNKSWPTVAREVLTAAVGIGAFALPRKIAKLGVVIFFVFLTAIGYVNYRVCTWWQVHKSAWNKEADKDPSLPRLDAYEDWGVVCFGTTFRRALWSGQLLYYGLVCVCYVTLCHNNAIALQDNALVKGWMGVQQPTYDNLCFGCSDQEQTDSVLAYMAQHGTVYAKLRDGACGEAFTTDSQDYFCDDFQGGELRPVDYMQVGRLGVSGTGWDRGESPEADLASPEQTIVKFAVPGRDGLLFLKWEDLQFFSGPATVSRDRIATMLTIGMLVPALVFQYISGVNKMLGVVGVAGVIGSWVLIIFQMLSMGFSQGGDEAGATAPEVHWMPTQLIQEKSWLQMAKDICALVGCALGAMGNVGLVPDFSRQLKDETQTNKALCVGHWASYLIYLLPIGLYQIQGKHANAMELIPSGLEASNTERWMSLFFRVFVIVNMVASFALTAQTPAVQLEKLTAGCGGSSGRAAPAVPIRWLVRAALAAVQVYISYNFPGSFDNLFTMITAFFLPVASIVCPVLFDVKMASLLKSRGVSLIFGPAMSSGPCHCESPMKRKAERVLIWLTFVLCIVTVFLGSWAGYEGAMEEKTLTGLKSFSPSLVTKA